MGMTENRKNELVQLIDEYVDSQLEYAEEHQDSGDSYSHMPREGGFDYGNGEARLKAYCAKNGLEYNDSLIDFVLDNFTMESCHQFENIEKRSCFYVDSYLINEVEVDLNYLISQGKLTESELIEIAGDCNSYITGQRAYTTSDRAWSAFVPLSDIKEHIEAGV